MRNVLFGLAIGLAASSATPAFAQRTPAPGTWGIGGSVGLTAPSDGSLDDGVEVAGNVEGYLTSRVSLRAQLATSSWDIVGRGFHGTVAPLRLDGNVVYNWEGGVVHPYLTGGVGVYHYRSSITGSVNGSDTEAGLNFGGGLEYFFARRATITGEVLYHHVGMFNTPVATFNYGSLWSFDGGLKWYLK